MGFRFRCPLLLRTLGAAEARLGVLGACVVKPLIVAVVIKFSLWLSINDDDDGGLSAAKARLSLPTNADESASDHAMTR